MRSLVAPSLLLLCSACPTATPAQLDASFPGNSCASAVTFTVPTDGGVLTLTGDTTDFANHASCLVSNPADLRTGAPGPDLLYRFTTDRPLALSASITGGTLHLGSRTCEPDCGAYSRTGPRPAPFDKERLDVPLRTPGEYSLIAEARGTYEIKVSSRPLVAGDTCDTAIVASFDGGVFTLEKDLEQLFYDGSLASGCLGTSRSVDFAIAVPVEAPSALRARAVSGDPNIGLKLKRSGQCTLDCISSGSDSLETAELVPGLYHLGVLAMAPGPREISFDSPASAHLELELRSLPRGDSCTDPLPLTFTSDGGSEVATASGDTTANVGGVTTACIGATNDAVVSFTLASPRNLTAVVTTTTATYSPVLELNAARCGTMSACAMAAVAGGGATLSSTALPPGPYFLRVGGFPSGAWSLTVTLTP